jgi:hypothetical protein
MRVIFPDKVLYETDSIQNERIGLQVVEGIEAVSEFGEHWDDLFVRATDATMYHSHIWVSTFVDEGRIRGTPHKSKGGCFLSNIYVGLWKLGRIQSVSLFYHRFRRMLQRWHGSFENDPTDV